MPDYRHSKAITEALEHVGYRVRGKGFKFAMKAALGKIVLIEQREHFYNLADQFSEQFKSIVQFAHIDTSNIERVGRFHVIIDDAELIETELIPWFKSKNFRCTSKKDSAELGDAPTKDFVWQYRYELSDYEKSVTTDNDAYWGNFYSKNASHWTVILEVGFTGNACTWEMEETGEFYALPAQPAQAARREPVMKRVLKCPD